MREGFMCGSFILDCELVDTERYLGFSFVGVTGIFFFFSFFKFLIFGLFSSHFFKRLKSGESCLDWKDVVLCEDRQ